MVELPNKGDILGAKGAEYSMLGINRSLNKIRNRCLVGIIVLSLLVTACGGATPPQSYTVGVINLSPSLDDIAEAFKESMSELGYVEGENVTYIYHGIVEPDPQAIDGEVKNLLAQDVDVLFTVGNLPALAAKQAVAGTDMPVVFGPMMKPVEEGLVANLRQPGGKVTGVTNGQGTAKALEWLVMITPKARKVYVPYNPDDNISVSVLAGLDKAPSQLGIELMLHEVHSVEEAVAAIENLPEDVDAIFRIPSPTLDPRNDLLSQAAIKRGLPLGTPIVLDEVVLLTYAADFFEVGKQAARLAHQIRQGVKPADLPVEMAEFYLAINLKTAEAIDLDIPDEILLQANIIVR
jgi:putative ABC transport system substrate-binding protein